MALHLIVPVLFFIAFLLLLLVSLSVPIIKSVYLFVIIANLDSSLFQVHATESVRFGVWGHCSSSVHLSDFATAGHCSRPHLGYTFDNDVARALHVQEVTNAITETTTAAFVLHPIACGLTFLVLLISLFMIRRNNNDSSRLSSLLTLIVGVPAALLATIVFLIDVILVAVVRHRISNATDGDLTVNWGNAVWMTLGAAIALWLALVGACVGVCACGSRNRKVNRY